MLVSRFKFNCWLVAIVLLACCTPKKQPVEQTPDIEIKTEFGIIGISLNGLEQNLSFQIIDLIDAGVYDNCLLNQSKGNFIGLTTLGQPNESVLVKADISDNQSMLKGTLIASKPELMSNPEQLSDISSLYLITGQKYNDSELDSIQLIIDEIKLEQFIVQYLSRPENRWINEFAKEIDFVPQADRDSVIKVLTEIRQNALKEWVDKRYAYKFSTESRFGYKRIGGLPIFEGQYVVMGRVVTGMDILDSLSAKLGEDKNGRAQLINVNYGSSSVSGTIQE